MTTGAKHAIKDGAHSPETARSTPGPSLLPGGRARRWYDDACGAAMAMELVGERWSIFVVRELMFGPRRFGQLRTDLPGISANILTQRLEALEQMGVVARRTLPAPASVQVYELTQWGYDAEPILLTMCRWALQSPAHDPMLHLSPVAMMLSLKSLFEPEKLIDAQAARTSGFTVGLEMGEDQFVARVVDGRLTIQRGWADQLDCSLTGSTLTMRRIFYGGQPLPDMVQAGALTVEGDIALAQRFARAFPFPRKAVSP